ncbi:hypothetical protein D3C72_1791660 [compost metagenome]
MHHVGQAVGRVGDLRHFLGMGQVRIDLEVDDGVVQFAGELADFLVQAAITDVVEFVDELHGVGEIAFLQAFHQLPRTDFQGRLEVSQQGFVVVHGALAADISR